MQGHTGGHVGVEANFGPGLDVVVPAGLRVVDLQGLDVTGQVFVIVDPVVTARADRLHSRRITIVQPAQALLLKRVHMAVTPGLPITSRSSPYSTVAHVATSHVVAF